jgi:competence protein ComGC
MQASAITALAVANQNEDLQLELNNARQELLKAQKEAYELRTKLADTQEQVNRLQAESAQHSTSHLAANEYAANHGHGNNQPQQMTNTTGPGVYQGAPYQTANNPMYQNHQAPSQGNVATIRQQPTY